MDKLKKKGARSLGGAKKKEYFCNYLGLLPFFILFGVFMLYPFLYGVVMSFTDWSVSSGKEGINFVGLSNYQFVLSGEGVSSERFLTSLKKFVHLCAGDLVDRHDDRLTAGIVYQSAQPQGLRNLPRNFLYPVCSAAVYRRRYLAVVYDAGDRPGSHPV